MIDAEAAFASRFTGLFTSWGPPALRPYDPDVPIWAASVAGFGLRAEPLAVGGAGWSEEEARLACLGEAIERYQTYPFPCDEGMEASFERWTRDEPAIAPGRWVLFHSEQYARMEFPYRPFDARTTCRWVAFRSAPDGAAVWIPEEFGFLFQRVGGAHRITPSISTGITCGRLGDPVLLRGLQEAIERDALMGAWWGRYPLEEWPVDEVLPRLGRDLLHRLSRPHLTYRLYRVATPYSAHVTIATMEGEDREGWLFSAGAACRERRDASWTKALLEAVQGWHYVRYLKPLRSVSAGAPRVIEGFADHALYYSLYPEELSRTVLRRARRVASDGGSDSVEGLHALRERLGPERPVLFRLLTPPSIARGPERWYVLKVVVPGLQPMHGHHGLPHLGGALWAPRGLAEWASMPPHPFP